MLSFRQAFIRICGVSRLTGHIHGITTSSTASSAEHTAESAESSTEETYEEDSYLSDEDGEEQLKLEILNASLPFVHSVGWSQDAIAQGAETLGYSGMVHGMFPGGGVELVNHFYSSCNATLEELLIAKTEEIQQNPELKKSTTAFIAEAVEDRLRMNIEHIDSWHRALALHASPTNAPQAIKNLGTLVDHIWYYAGDRSYEFDWYVKRGALAAVYKSSELCMLQDQSEDFQDTWAFLNRRLNEMKSIADCAQNVDSLSKDVRDITKAGVYTALNILGLNSKSR